MENQAVARISLFIAVLAGFLTPFDLSGVNIALPRIGAEFSMDAIALSWIPTAYLLASAVFLVPFGSSQTSTEEDAFSSSESRSSLSLRS